MEGDAAEVSKLEKVGIVAASLSIRGDNTTRPMELQRASSERKQVRHKKAKVGSQTDSWDGKEGIADAEQSPVRRERVKMLLVLT
jgi:hypothetical protein